MVDKTESVKGNRIVAKAVETNIPEAYSVMGQMYWEGNHILQDMDKAVEGYNKSNIIGIYGSIR